MGRPVRGPRTSLNSNHRFVALDGLRGVAAFAVVLYHAGTSLGLPLLAGRAYLAVDFFFVLSGFVLANAYEARMISGVITPLGFLALRYRRLWPMACFGTCIGAAVAVIAPSALHQSGSLLLATFLGATMLPNFTRSASGAFPLNPPHWSLTLELVANYAYGVVARNLSERRLAIGVAMAGIWLLADTVSFSGANRVDASRLAYGFFVGVAIWRVWCRGTRSPIVAPGLLATALCVCLFIPRTTAHDGVIDAALELFAFPALVFVGASSVVTGWWRRACRLLGAASYPVYALHYPILMLTLPYAVRWSM